MNEYKTITKEQVDTVVTYIIEKSQHPQIKKELESRGFKLIPNSLPKLRELLNSVGYDIVKKTATEENENKITENQEKKETNIIELKLFEFKNNNKAVSAEETTDDQKLHITNGTTTNQNVQQNNSPMQNQMPSKQNGAETNLNQNATVSENNSDQSMPWDNVPVNTQQEPMPWDNVIKQDNQVKSNIPLNNTITNITSTEVVNNSIEPSVKNEVLSLIKENWISILTEIKKINISLYSILVKAKVMDVQDNVLTIGFGTTDTYQLKQLNTEYVKNTFTEFINSKLNLNLTINTTVIRE